VAFMLPGYTDEEMKKMQQGPLSHATAKLFIFSWIFDRKKNR